jgi:hypothetical protein
MTKTRCLALAVCLLAVLPTAVQARSHRRAVRIGPWVGQYEVTLKKTTQDTTYTYHHAARGPCDASADGSGGSHALLAGGSGTVSATGVSPPGEFNTPAPSIQVQLGSLPSLLSHGTETRSTNVTYGQSSGCGSGGGGGSTPPAPDCGTKPVSETYSLIGTTAFQLEWQREQASSPPDAFSVCAQYAPWQFPSVLPVAIPLNPAQFGPGMPPADLHGHAVDNFTGESTGNTTADVELVMRPLAIVPAIGLASRSSSADVDSHGKLTPRVGCAASGPCSGTLAVELGAPANPIAPVSASVTGVPTYRFPAPLRPGFKGNTLASVRFSIKAGQKKKLKLRLKKHSASDLAQLRNVVIMLVATERAAHHKTVAYEMGRAQVR